MSIEDEIKLAKSSGRLSPVQPFPKWEGAHRVLLKSQTLQGQIDAGVVESLDRWVRLEADLVHFVVGGKMNSKLLTQLDPPKFEHWEFRSVRPRPSIRVFGRFALPDVFVATHAIERAKLKGKWDFTWEYEKLRCEDIWNEMFTCPPFSGSHYTDYVTENASENIRV